MHITSTVWVGGQLLNQLLIWLRSHLDDSRQMMEEILRDEQIEYHHNYWRAVSTIIITEGLYDHDYPSAVSTIMINGGLLV